MESSSTLPALIICMAERPRRSRCWWRSSPALACALARLSPTPGAQPMLLRDSMRGQASSQGSTRPQGQYADRSRLLGDPRRRRAYRVEIVLTDNGIQFADLPKNRSGPTAKFRGHPFDRVCREHGIEHRLTKPNHPWTNGQVERMNRTIKDATVKRYHYASHDQLIRHLDDFVAAYNFARRLKTLNGLTPYEFVCKRWTIEPQRFSLNPLQQMPGLNT
jgi:Integrase core domain